MWVVFVNMNVWVWVYWYLCTPIHLKISIILAFYKINSLVVHNEDDEDMNVCSFIILSFYIVVVVKYLLVWVSVQSVCVSIYLYISLVLNDFIFKHFIYFYKYKFFQLYFILWFDFYSIIFYFFLHIKYNCCSNNHARTCL